MVLSGYVTSESSNALSPQCVDEVLVGCGVKGSGVSVRVGGIAVGTVKPGLVGGRVEVTKRTGGLVGAVPEERVTQAGRSNIESRVRASNFFIGV